MPETDAELQRAYDDALIDIEDLKADVRYLTRSRQELRSELATAQAEVNRLTTECLQVRAKERAAARWSEELLQALKEERETADEDHKSAQSEVGYRDKRIRELIAANEQLVREGSSELAGIVKRFVREASEYVSPEG